MYEDSAGKKTGSDFGKGSIYGFRNDLARRKEKVSECTSSYGGKWKGV